MVYDGITFPSNLFYRSLEIERAQKKNTQAPELFIISSP